MTTMLIVDLIVSLLCRHYKRASSGRQLASEPDRSHARQRLLRRLPIGWQFRFRATLAQCQAPLGLISLCASCQFAALQLGDLSRRRPAFGRHKSIEASEGSAPRLGPASRTRPLQRGELANREREGRKQMDKMHLRPLNSALERRLVVFVRRKRAAIE